VPNSVSKYYLLDAVRLKFPLFFLSENSSQLASQVNPNLNFVTNSVSNAYVLFL
jgi:hypothetical protein